MKIQYSIKIQYSTKMQYATKIQYSAKKSIFKETSIFKKNSPFKENSKFSKNSIFKENSTFSKYQYSTKFLIRAGRVIFREVVIEMDGWVQLLPYPFIHGNADLTIKMEQELIYFYYQWLKSLLDIELSII